jgi:hypothetical protein
MNQGGVSASSIVSGDWYSNFNSEYKKKYQGKVGIDLNNREANYSVNRGNKSPL